MNDKGKEGMVSEQEYVIISQNLLQPYRVRIRKFCAVRRCCTIDFQRTINGNLVVSLFQTKVIAVLQFKRVCFFFYPTVSG